MTANDSSKQQKLNCDFRASVLFSPNEEWLIVNNTPWGGANLYHQSSGSDAMRLFYSPAGGTGPGKMELEDLAWTYYLRTTGRKANSDRNHIRIVGITWNPASNEVTIRISCFGSNDDRSVPAPWTCRYNVPTNEFTSP